MYANVPNEAVSIGHQPVAKVKGAKRSKSRSSKTSWSVVGLFAGIAGFEEGFRERGHQPVLFCETDAAARRVLSKRYPTVKLHEDIRTLKSLPPCDVVTAGFPCQDLSQVGRTKGIKGAHSSLIGEVFRLIESADERLQWLVIENVPFMLRLHRGSAIREITTQLTSLGWRWAYRTLDTQAFGLPQRRRRVILLASRSNDPRSALLGSDFGEPDEKGRKNSACGFYWTEGHRGLGWAKNAVPPLKGGSGLAIPSPPAIWFPGSGTIAVPTVEDAERLQGFAMNWTKPAGIDTATNRQRWRLLGNAVSVPLAKWIAERLEVRTPYDDKADTRHLSRAPWPDAAWGAKDGSVWKSNVSAWPVSRPMAHLASFLRNEVKPLSLKAAAGFLARLEHSRLKCDADFVTHLRKHVVKSGKEREKTDPRSSERMAATKSRDNSSETALRAALHREGFRFRVQFKPIKGLRRTADIAFPSLRLAVFLDGCFWHGCPLHGTWPKTNAKWWREKILANRKRDRDTNQRLRAEGWHAVRVWEHEDAEVVLKRLVHELRIRADRQRRVTSTKKNGKSKRAAARAKS
jgi:DNA (cytosine-5)-methyltransferase 1